MLFEVEISRSAVAPGVTTMSLRHRKRLRMAAEWKGDVQRVSLFGVDGELVQQVTSNSPGKRPGFENGSDRVSLLPSLVCGQAGFALAIALDALGAEGLGDVPSEAVEGGDAVGGAA